MQVQKLSPVDAPVPVLDRDQLIENHLAMVRGIASKWRARCRTAADFEELVQAGTVGLVEAAGRHDASRGVPFAALAARRIHGAICDHLRALDPLTRERRNAVRELRRTADDLRNRLGREPSTAEVGAMLRWTEAAHESARCDAAALDAGMAQVQDATNLDVFASPVRGTSDPDPLKALLDGEARERLAAAIASLGERDQMVLDLYYREELTMREVGEVLGLTESRVSQIHSGLVRKLRTIMSDAGETLALAATAG